MVIDALAREFSRRETELRSRREDRGIGQRESRAAGRTAARRLLPAQSAEERGARAVWRGIRGAHAEVRRRSCADLIATATVLTAATIAMAVRRTAVQRTHRPDRVRRRGAQPADHGAPGRVSTWGEPLYFDRSRHRRGCQGSRSRSRYWRTRPGAAGRRTCRRPQAPVAPWCWGISRMERAVIDSWAESAARPVWAVRTASVRRYASFSSRKRTPCRNPGKLRKCRCVRPIWVERRRIYGAEIWEMWCDGDHTQIKHPSSREACFRSLSVD